MYFREIREQVPRWEGLHNTQDINRSGYLEHDVARGTLKFQCKTWEFRVMSCSRHPDLFIQIHNCTISCLDMFRASVRVIILIH